MMRRSYMLITAKSLRVNSMQWCISEVYMVKRYREGFHTIPKCLFTSWLTSTNWVQRGIILFESSKKKSGLLCSTAVFLNKISSSYSEIQIGSFNTKSTLFKMNRKSSYPPQTCNKNKKKHKSKEPNTFTHMISSVILLTICHTTLMKLV